MWRSPVSPEDDQYEIEFPDEDYYPEPDDADLYAIENDYEAYEEFLNDWGWTGEIE